MSAVTLPTRPNIPRIIRSSTVPWKDGRTLLWCRAQDPSSSRWKIWDGIVTSFADMETWHSHVTLRACVLFTSEDVERLTPENAKWAESYFLSTELISRKPIPFWESLGVPIFNLTNLYANFPYLEIAWDGTPDDAVAIVALFYRYRQMSVDSEGWKGPTSRKTLMDGLGIKVQTSSPPQIWLLSQYFVHKNGKRAKEFRQCLKNNLLNPYLDKIVYLTETDLRSEWSSMRGKDKVIQEIIGERLTYKHMLQYTYEKIPENVIVVYANADIYLNETLSELYSVDMNDKLFALLRYDEDEAGELKLFGPRADSQDTWMLLSDSIKARTWNWAEFDYKLGTAGCDNRFTADMFAMRFVVSNPCQSIQTVHIHRTEIRDYNPRDILNARFYLHVNPCPILNMDQTKHISAKAGVLPSHQTMVTLRCPTPKQAHTFSVMLGRFKRFVWSHETPTPYRSPSRNIWKWSNASVIGSGIVFDYTKSYLDIELGGVYLQDATMPTHIEYSQSPVFVDQMLAIPTKHVTTLTNPDLYLINYFTQAIRLSEHLQAQNLPPCSFFIPENYMEITKYFRVADRDELNVVKWSPTSVVHAKTVYGFLPEGFEWGVEDIRTLRRSSRIPLANKTKKRCIVLTDAVFTEARAKEQIGGLLGDDWEVLPIGPQQSGPAVYSILASADLCMLYNLPERQIGDWAKLWAVPAGCKVLEFQNELKVTGEFQQFAAACEFETYLFPLHKAPVEDVFKQAMKYFEAWLKTE